MSIDPRITKIILQAQVDPSAPRQKTLPSAEAFEQLLNSATETVSEARIVAGQAAAWLKMAHLQLLHGLFDSAENSADFDPLDSLTWQPQPATAVGNRQQAEEIYRKLQPTLLETGPAGRTEIERMIDQVAETVSLAPELIRSVVAAESAFQPHAVSPAGAQGLMQLMPGTAAELGVTDSFDPQQNLLAGSRYLKQLLEKYAGDLDQALAAYNWGPGNVDRKGLAQMPQETRDYLARVKGLLKKQV